MLADSRMKETMNKGLIKLCKFLSLVLRRFCDLDVHHGRVNPLYRFSGATRLTASLQ